MDTRLKRHRKKLREGGVTRFSIQLDGDSVETLRRLCREHGKTQRAVLELALQAADRLLAGQLQVVARLKPSSAPAAQSRTRAEERAVMFATVIPAVATESAPEASAGAVPAAPDPVREVPAWYPDNYAELLREAGRHE